ncbi:MAG: MarR family transcriptional regulator [Thermoproteota archaeon]|nr:MarR family transcriptional regulator [Thermoproteota archaeon]
MNQNIKVTDSPKHFMVLDAISRGVGDIGKIAKVTKISKAEVEMILNDLAIQRLIIAKQKNSLFGKKVQAHITDNESKLLYFKKQELEEKARALKSMYMNQDRMGMQSFMDDNNRSWIPMMVFSGLISAIAFASMMSFMGMAMNPAEAAMTGDAANVDAQSVADTQSVADDGHDAGNAGADISTEESSSFDTAGGDFEF